MSLMQKSAYIGLILSTLLSTSVPMAFAQDSETLQMVVMLRGRLEAVEFVGAGVIVGIQNDRLYVATANHVVRRAANEAEDLEVLLRWLPGEWLPARLLSDVDRNLDLAVVGVDNADELAIPRLKWDILGDPVELRPGDEVVPVGQPAGTTWYVPQTSHLVAEVGTQDVRTEGDLQPGNSGGALFTGDGRVVGLVSSIGTLLGRSTRIDLVLSQLRRWNYPVDLEFGDRSQGSGGQLDRVAAFQAFCASRSCFSLRYNDVCGVACAQRAADTLRAALGVPVQVSAGGPIGSPGCVGWRPDLGGTREMAQLVLDALGPQYRMGLCASDGFPINVRAN